jgi:hypothetical protein
MSHRTYRAAGTVALCLAATLFVLAAITWAYKGIALSGVAALVGTVLLIAAAALKDHQHWSEHHEKHGFWYEVTKDFVGPLVIAGAGLYFGYQLEKQRGLEAENQSKATILRQMMTGRDGPDVAFFTAVGERPTVHLRRYEKFSCSQDHSNVGEDAEKAALFDERAIYFFYGMYRVAWTDFLATKGYVLYPRVWMEEAFLRVTKNVIKDFMCSKEDDLSASAVEEAALYHYFGASRATYHSGSRSPEEPVSDLFGFNHMLEDAETCGGAKPYEAELLKGFHNFQERLKKIQPEEIITSFEAIEGLDDYAFNKLFSDWYKKQFHPDLPVEVPNEPPEDFLSYPLDNFIFKSDVPDQKNKEWEAERQKAWEAILKNLPDDFKEKNKSASPIP